MPLFISRQLSGASGPEENSMESILDPGDMVVIEEQGPPQRSFLLHCGPTDEESRVVELIGEDIKERIEGAVESPESVPVIILREGDQHRIEIREGGETTVYQLMHEESFTIQSFIEDGFKRLGVEILPLEVIYKIYIKALGQNNPKLVEGGNRAKVLEQLDLVIDKMIRRGLLERKMDGEGNECLRLLPLN